MLTIAQLEEALTQALFPNGQVDMDLIKEAVKFYEIQTKQRKAEMPTPDPQDVDELAQ
jgi:hypothetical protein